MSIDPFTSRSPPLRSRESDAADKRHDVREGKAKAIARQGEPDPRKPTAAVRPFPAPGVSYRRRRQELVRSILAEEFREFCRSHPDLTDEQALSAFLDAVKDQHPALNEEMVSHGFSDARLDDCNGKVPHRHVELYIAFPISEHARKAFERWLEAHPSISEEDAAALLLERGLQVEQSTTEETLRHGGFRRSTGCRSRMAKLRALLAHSCG